MIFPRITDTIFCLPQDEKALGAVAGEVVRKMGIKSERVGGFEIVSTHLCDPDRAYIVDGAGVVHTLILDRGAA